MARGESILSEEESGHVLGGRKHQIDLVGGGGVCIEV